MKTLTILAVTMLLAGCGGGSTTVQPIQPPPAIQHIPARSNVVAFMGDSITARWASTGAMPGLAGAVELDVGVGGDTTAMMLARFQHDVIDAMPEVGVVVIDGGVNDWPHTTDPVTIDNIKQMAAMATQVGIRVILCSVMLQDYNWTFGARRPATADIEAFNQQLLTLAQKEGYQYADYLDVMLLPDGTQDFSLYIDNLHPDDEGYRHMWKVVQPLIMEALQ